jgi:uncharacterized protein (TIGR02145 family)
MKNRTITILAFSLFASLLSAAYMNSDSMESFTDSRDGKKYNTVKIGGKTWMAQNLNYETGNSWCYDNNKGNCQKYGRLYDWNTAMAACPAGWRLPDNEDWDNLARVVGGQPDENGGWIIAGEKLKSKIGWSAYHDGVDGNGTDDFGFSALPGGSYRIRDDNFSAVGLTGAWWSAAENGASNAWRQEMYRGSYLFSGDKDKGNGYSVRCVQK